MTPRRLSPPVALMGSFAVAIAAGTVLLRLPFSTHGEPLTLLEALFTATSATCVTGLTVVDTGTRFTTFGQCVILVLMQAGGLGIMTFAVLFAVLLGRRISFTDRLVVQDSMHHSPSSELRRLLLHVVVFTFAVEAVGAALLWLRWREEFGAGPGAYASVFFAVSSFCNAGFSLFPDSLVRYRGDAAVNLVVSALAVLGGLGFLVNMELRDQVVWRLRRRRPPRLSLHAKLVLAVTAWLLVAGVAGALLLEWGNLLGGLPWREKLLATWFQAVVARTAGFNTVDFTQASTATLFFTILLMFVGASPGSTGGGIKTTSLGLLLALAWARWRGYTRPMLFRRTIPDAVVNRAMAVTLVSWLVASAALMLLTLFEQGTRPYGAAEPRFVALMFEAVSALGTVGLSTGVTPRLTEASQLLLVVLMFVGRVGPLTIALLAGHRRGAGRFEYAEETVMVG
ncbi:MAG TPA: TrkH family potassium uptake protein [Vicinamibacteria bacterium]|nr:TrkH family potassium uptake protein [Vicinamibacteria bacterium]